MPSPTRRLLLSASAVALALAVPGGAAASEPPPPNGAQDFIAGGFTNQFCQVALLAHDGPNGDNHRGVVRMRCGPDRENYFRGPVVCVDVDGNRGGLVWRIDETNVPAFEGRYQPFWVVDNGPPSSPVPDLTGSGALSATQPAGCSALGPTPTAVLRGNIVVHESGPALPPSP